MKKKLSVLCTTKNMLIIFSAICVILIGATFFTDKLANPLKGIVSHTVIPLQKGLNNIGLWTADKVEMMQEIVDVLDKNKELQSEVDRLNEENNLLRQDTYELDRLRELYALDQNTSTYTKVGARVIAKDPGNWFASFTIDKGSKDGIEVDMNVIAGGGLVGIVTEVGDSYAQVQSIIDDNSNVSAMLIDTNSTCYVKGSLKLMDTGMLYLSNFKKDVVVRDGDKVVTSNISSKYLEGLLIGYAKDVKNDSNNLTQSGYIVPVVDFEHLQEVLVILEKK